LALNETPDSDPLAEQPDNETDSMTPPRELATEFHRVLDRRKESRQREK